MPYVSNGSLISDVREANESATWDTQADWEGNQSADRVVVESGAVQLQEFSVGAIIDTFDDPSYGPDGTLGDNYGGDLGSFSRDDSIRHSGSHSAVGSGTNVIITNTDQTFTDPFTIRGWIYAGEGGNFGLAFAAQSETGAGSYSGYTARVRHDNNLLDIGEWTNGGSSRIADVNLDPPDSEWYYMEVSISSGTVSASLYEFDGTQIGTTVSTSSSAYSSGGYGLFVSGDQGRFDTISDES